MKNANQTKGVVLIACKVILFAFCVLFSVSQILAAPGRFDLNFPQILASGANVTAIEIQPDGKILVAGEFVTRGAIVRNDVIRLNTDGSLDTTFDTGTGTSDPSLIRFMKLQADGKILIAGYINQLNGISARSILRLNTNGSIDATFNLSGIDVTFVNDLDIQTDGKILISAQNLIGSSFVTRLKADGSNDQGTGQPLFSSAGGFNYRVTFSPPDNKIFIGGKFVYTVNQTQYNNLVRLNPDGTIDTTFTANVTNTTFDLMVNTKIIGGGKILVWGRFDTVNGTTRRNLAVLNTNGSLDTIFNPATSGAENFIGIVVQTDGKIIVGGSNFKFNTFLRGNVARLNADGTVDTTFNQGRGTNFDVRAVKIRNDNKLLIGGTFSRYHIYHRNGLAQVNL